MEYNKKKAYNIIYTNLAQQKFCGRDTEEKITFISFSVKSNSDIQQRHNLLACYAELDPYLDYGWATLDWTYNQIRYGSTKVQALLYKIQTGPSHQKQ